MTSQLNLFFYWGHEPALTPCLAATRHDRRKRKLNYNGNNSGSDRWKWWVVVTGLQLILFNMFA